MSQRKPFRDTRVEHPLSYTKGVRFPPGAPGYHSAASWRNSLLAGARTQRHTRAVKDIAEGIFATLLPSLEKKP